MLPKYLLPHKTMHRWFLDDGSFGGKKPNSDGNNGINAERTVLILNQRPGSKRENLLLHSASLPALRFLPSNVIPHVPNPLLFADFFMQAYEYAGVIGVLVLDGLFVLMTQHGLEYPLFYTSLYGLMQPKPFEWLNILTNSFPMNGRLLL